MELDIYGSKYILEFTNPIEIDSTDVMRSKQYTKANVRNTHKERLEIDIVNRN